MWQCLYLVTDGFGGDLFDLAHFTISALRSYKHVPYPAEARGFITISAAISISSMPQAEVECSSV